MTKEQILKMLEANLSRAIKIQTELDLLRQETSPDLENWIKQLSMLAMSATYLKENLTVIRARFQEK